MLAAEPTSLWRHAEFRKLWAGQSISEFGSQVNLLAMPLTAVLVLRATAFEVGALNALVMAPFLIFGLPAGAIVDRLPMRMVMIVSDAARLVIVGSVPIAAAFDVLTLAQLYVVAFLSGIFTVFFDVAYQSYLPMIVTKEQLTDGNAKLTSTEQVALIGGPAAGGALVSAVGAAKALGVDALSYLASVASLIAMRPQQARPPREADAAPANLLNETKEGLQFVLRHPLLRKIAACTASANLAGDIAFAVLTVYMVRSLHLSPARIGLLFAVGSVAGLIGAVSATRMITLIGVGPTIVGSIAVSSLGGFGLPLATPGAGTWWIAGGLGTFLMFSVIYNVAQVSLRQAICPPELLGRMNATMRFVVFGVIPIGALIGGALGGTIGLRQTLWVGAFSGLIAPLWVLFSPVRSLREIPLDDNPEPDVVPSAVGPLPEI